jgi:hypothetical protein
MNPWGDDDQVALFVCTQFWNEVWASHTRSATHCSTLDITLVLWIHKSISLESLVISSFES